MWAIVEYSIHCFVNALVSLAPPLFLVLLFVFGLRIDVFITKSSMYTYTFTECDLHTA